MASVICGLSSQEDETEEGAASCQGNQRTGAEEERGRQVGW